MAFCLVAVTAPLPAKKDVCRHSLNLQCSLKEVNNLWDNCCLYEEMNQYGEQQYSESYQVRSSMCKAATSICSHLYSILLVTVIVMLKAGVTMWPPWACRPMTTANSSNSCGESCN